MTDIIAPAAPPTVFPKVTRDPEKEEEEEEGGITLQAYGGPLENVKLMTPCYPDTPMEELRRRYEEDGFVWIKNILPRPLVLQFRSDYLAFVNNANNPDGSPPTGMLKEGTAPLDGIFRPGADWRDFLLPGGLRAALGVSQEGPFVERSNLSHRWLVYLAFKAAVASELSPLIASLRGFDEGRAASASSHCLGRSLLRCAVPGGDSTPVHYDQTFLRAGPPTSVTAWVPIGDIGARGGGLVYLDKGHEVGRQREAEFSVLNAGLSAEDRISAYNENMMVGGWLERNASEFGRQCGRSWWVGNYEAGDVVLHHPYTVHAGAMNESPEGRIRCSTDLRFVDKSKPYDLRWESIAYADGDPSDSRKVYTKDNPLTQAAVKANMDANKKV